MTTKELQELLDRAENASGLMATLSLANPSNKKLDACFDNLCNAERALELYIEAMGLAESVLNTQRGSK